MANASRVMRFCFVFCRCASVHPEPAQPESDADLIRSTDPSHPKRSPRAAAARPGKQQVEKHDPVSVHDHFDLNIKQGFSVQVFILQVWIWLSNNLLY